MKVGVGFTGVQCSQPVEVFKEKAKNHSYGFGENYYSNGNMSAQNDKLSDSSTAVRTKPPILATVRVIPTSINN